MALVTNNAEGGTNTTTVTTGNSGGASGTAFAAVNAGITYSSTQKAHGALAYAFAGTAATFNTVTLNSGDGTTTGYSVRIYAYLTGYPSAETNFISIQTAGGVGMSGFNLTTTGLLKVVHAGGTAGTYTTPLSLNTWYRITIYGTVSATTAALNTAMYALDSGTAVESHNYTNLNTGSTAMGKVLYGKLTQAPGMTTYYIDDIAQDANLNAEIAAVANTPPTVDAGADQNVAASVTVNLSASANDPDGTIASHAWTFDYPTSGAPTLTGASTATPSFNSGSAGSLYILRDTVTDNSGATASDTVEVRVPVPGPADMLPLPGYTPTGVGSWSNVGGAASEGAALIDSSDTTYVEGPDVSATEASRRWRLRPVTVETSGKVVVRVAQSTAGTLVAVARVYEGSTLREEVAVTVSTTITTRTISLAPATIAAITDWGNLYLELAEHT